MDDLFPPAETNSIELNSVIATDYVARMEAQLAQDEVNFEKYMAALPNTVALFETIKAQDEFGVIGLEQALNLLKLEATSQYLLANGNKEGANRYKERGQSATEQYYMENRRRPFRAFASIVTASSSTIVTYVRELGKLRQRRLGSNYTYPQRTANKEELVALAEDEESLVKAFLILYQGIIHPDK